MYYTRLVGGFITSNGRYEVLVLLAAYLTCTSNGRYEVLVNTTAQHTATAADFFLVSYIILVRARFAWWLVSVFPTPCHIMYTHSFSSIWWTLTTFLFLTLASSAAGQECNKLPETGPCKFCQAIVTSANPGRIVVTFGTDLVHKPLQIEDWTVNLHLGAATITSVQFLHDNENIELLFTPKVVTNEIVTFTYRQNHRKEKQLLESQSSLACDSHLDLHVSNEVAVPIVTGAVIYGIEPGSIVITYDLPLDVTSALVPLAWYLQWRDPTSQTPDAITLYQVATAVYRGTNKVVLTMANEYTIKSNSDIISVVYDGDQVKSIDGQAASQLKPGDGRLHEGFPVNNQVLDATLSFKASINCYPYAHMWMIEIDMTAPFIPLSGREFNDTKNDFVLQIISHDTEKVVKEVSLERVMESSVEADRSKIFYLKFSEPFKAEPKPGTPNAAYYTIRYTRPAIGSPREYASQTKVLGNQTVIVTNNIHKTQPTIVKAILNEDPVTKEQFAYLTISSILNTEVGSPWKSRTEQIDWGLLIWDGQSEKKHINAHHIEICPPPIPCIRVFFKEEVTAHDTIRLWYSADEFHISDKIYDRCGNVLKNQRGASGDGGMYIENRIPPPATTLPPVTPAPVTPAPVTPAPDTPAPAPPTPSASPVSPASPSSSTKLRPANTGTTTATPTTPSGSTNHGSPNGSNGTNNNPSGKLDKTSLMILWVTGGTILGLVTGAGCLFCCCASGDKKRGATLPAKGQRKIKKRYRDKTKNRNKHSEQTRKNSRMGKRHSFDAFQDESESSDEGDDVNMLQLGPISSNSKENQFEDEFEDDDFDDF